MKDRYHKDDDKKEAAEYFLGSKELLKENKINKFRSLSEEEKKVRYISFACSIKLSDVKV